MKDADNNVYNTVKIGTQCWMKQNMRVGTRINGAGNQTNNGMTEKHCYNDQLANCMSTNHPNYPDGGLYEWDEVMKYSRAPGTRGICPIGRHVPTNAQFGVLESYLGSGTAGTKLKVGGVSGFEANLTGYTQGGTSMFIDWDGTFWTSSESAGSGYYRRVNSIIATFASSLGGKTNGMSVRCLRD